MRSASALGKALKSSHYSCWHSIPGAGSRFSRRLATAVRSVSTTSHLERGDSCEHVAVIHTDTTRLPEVPNGDATAGKALASRRRALLASLPFLYELDRPTFAHVGTHRAEGRSPEPSTAGADGGHGERPGAQTSRARRNLSGSRQATTCCGSDMGAAIRDKRVVGRTVRCATRVTSSRRPDNVPQRAGARSSELCVEEVPLPAEHPP